MLSDPARCFPVDVSESVSKLTRQDWTAVPFTRYTSPLTRLATRLTYQEVPIDSWPYLAHAVSLTLPHIRKRGLIEGTCVCLAYRSVWLLTTLTGPTGQGQMIRTDRCSPSIVQAYPSLNWVDHSRYGERWGPLHVNVLSTVSAEPRKARR